ncbi:MAG: PAS domain-containing protein [Mariniphaga sp.]|nr:PAS domain-containing protein [Mariniphaga sp.]MDD4424925.1 PAS domain-containing protein [Mariniphaga sp.]
MSSNNIPDHEKSRLMDLEQQISDMKFELQEIRELLKNEKEQRQFYQLIADFTFGWELWFEPTGKIKYCSPSSYDLTGFTANQIISAQSVSELLVFQADREKFDLFLSQALHQFLANPSLEFRILTRTRQLRWCAANIRGVYNRQGRYLGIRASVQDITRLKGALVHINDLSAGKELENRNRQRLKSELEMKERELVAFLLQLSQKNELISRFSQQLKIMLGDESKITPKMVEEILIQLENTPVDPFDWNMLEIQLEKLHPGFQERLLLKHPKLTSKDEKLCVFLRLGLTSKEIAGLTDLAPQSVEIARVRLRKKLRLQHQTRLVNYLLEI